MGLGLAGYAGDRCSVVNLGGQYNRYCPNQYQADAWVFDHFTHGILATGIPGWYNARVFGITELCCDLHCDYPGCFWNHPALIQAPI